jgi:hypothetical protein
MEILMTFRMLFEMMQSFVRDNPDHEALDEHIVVRVQTDEANGDDLHVGGLRSAAVDAGCTDTWVLVLDADQEPDKLEEKRRRRPRRRRTPGIASRVQNRVPGEKPARHSQRN